MAIERLLVLWDGDRAFVGAVGWRLSVCQGCGMTIERLLGLWDGDRASVGAVGWRSSVCRGCGTAIERLLVLYAESKARTMPGPPARNDAEPLMPLAGFTEDAIALHVARFSSQGAREDDELSLCTAASELSHATRSTSAVSCIETGHSASRMSERHITIENVQRAKKYGMVSLELQCTRSEAPAQLERAEHWIAGLLSCREYRVSVVSRRFVPEASRPRVEIGLCHQEKVAPKIKTWLIAHEFFDIKGHRLAFTDQTTRTKVIEKKDLKDGKIKVITVFCAHQIISNEEAEGRRFLNDLEIFEANTDTFYIESSLIKSFDAKGRVRMIESAQVQFIADGTVFITGQEVHRQRAWTSIKARIISMAIPQLRSGRSLKDADDIVQSSREAVLIAVQMNGLALRYAAWELRSDITIVLSAVGENCASFQYASSRLQSDRHCVIELTKINGLVLKYASHELRSDRDVVLSAIGQNVDAVQFAASSLKTDPDILLLVRSARIRKDVILEIVQEHGHALEHLSDSFRDDPVVVLAALLQNGSAIKHASPRLKTDWRLFVSKSDLLAMSREFILEVLEFDVDAILVAAPALKQDRDFVLQAVQRNGFALQHVESNFKRDVDVVRFALAQNKDIPFVLTFSSKKDEAGLRARKRAAKQKDDEEQDLKKFILQLVQADGMLLRYASSEVRSCREIVLSAVQSDGGALEFASEDLKCCPKLLSFASESLRANKAFMMEVVQRNGLALRLASKELRNSRSIVAAAVMENALALTCASHSLRVDHLFNLSLIHMNGLILEHIADELKQSADIMLAAVQNNSKAYLFVPDELKFSLEILPYTPAKLFHDYEFMIEAVKRNGLAIQFASNVLKRDQRIVTTAIKQNVGSAAHLSEKCAVLCAVKQDVLSLKYCKDTFRDDWEIAVAAVNQDIVAIQYISDHLQQDVLFYKLDATNIDNGTVFNSLHCPSKKYLKDLIMKALGQNGLYLKRCTPLVARDIELVKVAVQQNGLALQYASDELKRNQSVCWAAVKQNLHAMQHTKVSLTANIDLEATAAILAQIHVDGLLLSYCFCSKLHLHNREILLAALNQNPAATKFVPSIAWNDPDFLRSLPESLKSSFAVMRCAVKENGLALAHASEGLRNHLNIVLEAVNSNGLALQYASEAMRQSRIVVNSAILQDRHSLKFAAGSLQLEYLAKHGPTWLQYADSSLTKTVQLSKSSLEQDELSWAPSTT